MRGGELLSAWVGSASSNCSLCGPVRAPRRVHRFYMRTGNRQTAFVRRGVLSDLASFSIAVNREKHFLVIGLVTSFAPAICGGFFLLLHFMAKQTLEKRPSPSTHAARLDMWAREKVKSAKIKKKPVTEYVPDLHNPEPYYRIGSKDAFKCPSLIGNKRVPYWGKV